MLQKTYDFDMIPVSWFNSLSPGNEQKFYFGSAARRKAPAIIRALPIPLLMRQ